MRVGIVGNVHTDLVPRVIDSALSEAKLDCLVFNGRIVSSYSIVKKSAWDDFRDIGLAIHMPWVYVRRRAAREVREAEELIDSTENCYNVWNGEDGETDVQGKQISKFFFMDGLADTAFVARSPFYEDNDLQWRMDTDRGWLTKLGFRVGFFGYRHSASFSCYERINGSSTVKINTKSLVGGLRKPVILKKGIYMFNAGAVDQEEIEEKKIFNPRMLVYATKGRKRTIDTLSLSIR